MKRYRRGDSANPAANDPYAFWSHQPVGEIETATESRLNVRDAPITKANRQIVIILI